MPQPIRQVPRLVKPPTAIPTSILSTAIPVGDITDDYLKFVLYGTNRIGKTTLACQFPKPLLLISFEIGKSGGARSVKKVDGVKYLPIASTKAAIQLAEELKRDKTYVTHALDTCTSLQDIALKELMGLNKLPVQLDWGTVDEDVYRERSEKTKEILRLYRDLPAHTIFIAQERDHNPAKGREGGKKLPGQMQVQSYFAADLGWATAKWLNDACDYIGQLYMDEEVRIEYYKEKVAGKEQVKKREIGTGKNVRRLRTMVHPNYAAGFRSENKDKVPEFINEPTYDKILRVIQGI